LEAFGLPPNREGVAEALGLELPPKSDEILLESLEVPKVPNESKS